MQQAAFSTIDAKEDIPVIENHLLTTKEDY